MTRFALGLFAIFIAAYIAFGLALLYHIRSYAPVGDPSHIVARIFIVLSVIGLGAATYFFFQVPWEAIRLGFPLT